MKDEFSWFSGGSRTASPTVAETPSTGEIAPRQQPLKRSMLIGRLEIPRLHMKAMVREGADEGTLRKAVGHIPGTALPGAIGNVGLAGHRDTFFRGLRNIERTTPSTSRPMTATFATRCSRPKSSARATWGFWLPRTGTRSTLVTCYPFYYVGSAPKRFIVRARQVRRLSRSTSRSNEALKLGR